jgi:hypothetical protein
MKKSLIVQLFALVAMVTFMASCTKNSQEYVNVIPADASAVVGIHVRSLIDKSGVSDDDKQRLIDAIKSGLNAATFQQVEKIMKDGSASGLSLKEPVYFFTGGLLTSGAVVVKMDDMDKFNKALEVILPEISDDPVTEADGYRLFRFSGGVCAFNESALLIVDTGADDETVSNLMTQGKAASIASTAYFESMSAMKGDVIFFSTPDALPDRYKRQMSTALNTIERIDPKDIAVVGGLSFEKGRIALQVETVSENKEVREMLSKQSSFYGKLNETFLPYFPASTLAYTSFNVNGEKLYDTLLESEDLRGILSPDKAGVIKDLLGAFKGDISIGLIDATITEVPTIAAYAEATSGAALHALYESKAALGLGRWEDIVRRGEDQYVYKTVLLDVFFGYKDNYIYATTDESICNNLGKEADQSLKDAAYAPNMKGKRQYLVIDVKAILDLPVVKMLTAMGGRAGATYLDAARNISRIELAGEGNNRMNINIWLTNEEANSLKQTIDLIERYAGI